MASHKRIIFALAIILALLLGVYGALAWQGRSGGGPSAVYGETETEREGPEITAAVPAEAEEEKSIVFFGDSITAWGDWNAWFPEAHIVNLGVPGDRITDMEARVASLASYEPDKIFILGGINSLLNLPVDTVLEQYGELLASVCERAEAADLYVLSVLPFGRQLESESCDNASIERFNGELRGLAEEYGATYVDIYPYYVSDGCLNEGLTTDGLHLTPEAYEYWADAIREYMER